MKREDGRDRGAMPRGAMPRGAMPRGATPSGEATEGGGGDLRSGYTSGREPSGSEVERQLDLISEQIEDLRHETDAMRDDVRYMIYLRMHALEREARRYRTFLHSGAYVGEQQDFPFGGGGWPAGPNLADTGPGGSDDPSSGAEGGAGPR